MQKFLIGPMCVTKEDFKQQLKKNGLKFGYIKRLYEKWKDDDLTYFRVIIEDCPFVIVTDDEKSYPEISEEIGKKVEPYSFEWLVELEDRANLCGPPFYGVLLNGLQMYIRAQMAERRELDEEQKNCPYCDEQLLAYEIGADEIPESGKGYAIEHGDIKSFIAKENGKYYLRHNFTPNSSDFFLKMEIKFCPICGRKLEA